MQHPTYFTDFLKDRVNLNDARLQTLETSITAIQTAIEDSDYATGVRFFRRQGSLAHQTIVRPLEGQPFDADLIMVVREKDGWVPSDYVYDLRRVLRNHPRYSDKVRLSDVCVTVEYVGDKKVDIVPLVQVSNKNNNYHICHRIHNEYIRSEPIGFTSWLIEKNAISGGNSFRKVTRILKYIRNYKRTFSCPSVLLTTLIGLQITDNDRGSVAFENTPTTLKTILERLTEYLGPFDTRPTIQNPSYPQEDLGLLWTEDQYANFKAKISTFSRWANDAFDEADHNESLKKWRKLLGEEFAEGKDQVKEAKSESAGMAIFAADAAHPDTLVDAVVKFGVKLLSPAFYRPPHLKIAPWLHAPDGSLCHISATYHQGRGSSGRPVADGEPVPAHGFLRFDCVTFGLSEAQSAYHVQWRVTNTGLLAKMRSAMRGDFYQQSDRFTRWEPLAFRGVHFVEAFVLRTRDNYVVCQSRPFNVVIK